MFWTRSEETAALVVWTTWKMRRNDRKQHPAVETGKIDVAPDTMKKIPSNEDEKCPMEENPMAVVLDTVIWMEGASGTAMNLTMTVVAEAGGIMIVTAPITATEGGNAVVVIHASHSSFSVRKEVAGKTKTENSLDLKLVPIATFTD